MGLVLSGINKFTTLSLDAYVIKIYFVIVFLKYIYWQISTLHVSVTIRP
jgi:hypothetical protein